MDTVLLTMHRECHLLFSGLSALVNISVSVSIDTFFEQLTQPDTRFSARVKTGFFRDYLTWSPGYGFL